MYLITDWIRGVHGSEESGFAGRRVWVRAGTGGAIAISPTSPVTSSLAPFLSLSSSPAFDVAGGAPRRHRRLLAHCGGAAVNYPRVPPLVRQLDRRSKAVEDLVDLAAHLIKLLWPLVDKVVGGLSVRSVLRLIIFLQKIFRYLRTNCSTLLVALYCLVNIKRRLPSTPPTADEALRPERCGAAVECS
ncbi:MAG: hypothetical protein M1826_002495 [Phylliscum demangeonii]|nr:MAG: hypothetical protein M1826_002495 [Phylliscum demangeonii]